MESMKKMLLIASLVVGAVVVGLIVRRHFTQEPDVQVQGFNGIGIGGGDFALGFGETDGANGGKKRPVVLFPWGGGQSQHQAEEDMDEDYDA